MSHNCNNRPLARKQKYFDYFFNCGYISTGCSGCLLKCIATNENPMVTRVQTTVIKREYCITKFCEKLSKEGEIWHLLALIRNKSGVPAESYGVVNIKNASLQYYVYRLLTRWGICLSILPGTIKHVPQYKAVC